MDGTPDGIQIPGDGFRRRRIVNWMALGILYAFFYATRYNYTAVAPVLAEIFGWKNTELGVFETIMPLVYGLSVVLNGPLADRVGGKKAFLFGAAGVVVANFLFGLAGLAVVSPATWEGTGTARHVLVPAVMSFGMSGGLILTLMAVVWGINGYFQSFGALSIVKVNAQWFQVRERGTFSGIFGVLIRMGLLLAFQGVPLILLVLPWRYAFWIPGACVAVMLAVNYFWMENSPAEAGFTGFDTGDGSEDDGSPSSLRYVLAKVFGSRVTWTIALGSMMIGFVRRSVVDAWWPKYFVDFHGARSSSFAT
jgi:OPA family glycerol-3-phosphate transporter-like MFS transporter